MKPLEQMKKMNSIKFLAAGIALAGYALASGAHAQTSVLFGGGNASQTLLYDRVTNILTGGVTSVTISPANSTVRTYVGTIAGQDGLGTVTINFSLLGAGQGLQDLLGQNPEALAIGGSAVPTVAVSSASPQAAIDSETTALTATETLVVPYAYIKNSSESPNLANVTNLTQRQAAYLEGAAGTLPSAFFGGSSTNDTVYLVPRNTASAVRLEIDATVYFTGTIAAWTTNGTGNPGTAIPDPNGGQSSGSAVRNVLKALPNAIGTVAASDISTDTPLAYEGVPFSIANVENGSYPLWFYEQWFWLNPNQQGSPSPNQLIVINALLGAVTDATFQASSSLFVGNFAPLDGLQVQRFSDGGPITSLNY
jgi:hypothetical protein